MRLDFNILWVEDQKDKVSSQREVIERRMRNEGFKLQTEFVSSVEEAEAHLSDNIFRDHIDLVLMDFDLAGEENGDEGLEVVRESCPYKDIIFYSAQVPTELKEMVIRKELSGVYCTSRQYLPDTVLGIFGVLVKKVLDIDHSRGIVMGATSEIDEFINQALELYLSKTDKETKSKALEIAQNQIKKIKSEFDKDYEELENTTDATKLKDSHKIYSSVKRLILLRKLLEFSGRTDIDIKSMIEYEHKILPKRNILAHVTVQREGFSRKIVYKNGEELTDDDVRTLRVDLLKHHEMFEEIMELLQAN